MLKFIAPLVATLFLAHAMPASAAKVFPIFFPRDGIDGALVSQSLGPLQFVGTQTFVFRLADASVTNLTITGGEPGARVSLYGFGSPAIGYLDADGEFELQAPVQIASSPTNHFFGEFRLFGTPGYVVQSITLRGKIFAHIPEPTTWAMMIVGFGLTGSALRRRPMVPA